MRLKLILPVGRQVLAVASATLLVGCAEFRRGSVTMEPHPALGDERGMQLITVTDDDILRQMHRRMEILGAERYAGAVIEVSNGVVTLSGTVPDAAAKSRLEWEAKHVDGVRKVINNLEMALPPAP
jgi:hypothetical protein